MPVESNQPAHESDTRDSTIEDNIDLEELAKKIHEMMKRDARIERERLGRHRTW